MNKFPGKAQIAILLGAAAIFAPASLSAQDQEDAVPETSAPTNSDVVVYGTPPADLTGLEEGPVVEGVISARKDERMQVTTADGTRTVVFISDATTIKSKKGLFGLDRDKLAANQLLNGLPVKIKTVQWSNSLVASKIDLKDKDLKTASMIQLGTEQGFAEQTAATEALRGRVADIDQYNIKGTTNVYFDTGKWRLTPQAEAELCGAASQAGATENALLLVVGYTDSVGDYDYNQTLSEKRASKVVNHLQQACGWKPYRMLTPTGMAEADPVADNSTPEGKAQNRRVSVNILVSKSVDGL
ncbi:OmpA family protein [Sphingorhabdus arenilitoris]|uniref:OmpA family protein n=1 Tax=Sphingorhabdus arenilitoris TaxID=1490041 RepID=A0ABV8RBV6_9SPHN